MIKFENTEVVGWEHAIRGMRNPMNSWEKSDSGIKWFTHEDVVKMDNDGVEFIPVSSDEDGQRVYMIGPNDMKLIKNLVKSGTDHRKFMRMIVVYVDITAPLYWWKEFDTYKVGTVVNSCSTMHKIADKKFTLEDFSCEHLFDDTVESHSYASNIKQIADYKGALELIINILNNAREWYLETKDKKYWWQMIQLLPSSYNQKRTVMMSYEVLANQYSGRYGHPLDEWKRHEDGSYYGFCDWIKNYLPYSELITGDFKE